jgi:2-haloacid dehalogenase
MNIDRRRFVTLAASALAASSALASKRRALPSPTVATSAPAGAPLRAVAFDGLVVFDTRRAAAVAEAQFPGRGAELVSAWRARQFDYQWLRALGGRYADFVAITRDSLDFAARSLGLALSDDASDALMGVYLELDVWPDAPAALRALKASGLKLAFLSNMTSKMLIDGLERAGLDDVFDVVASADDIRTYKPAPHAYALGAAALELPVESILFAASAGWDAAGAKWFGYPTFWVNRGAAPDEALDARPDGAGRGLAELASFVRERAMPLESAVSSRESPSA